MALSQSQKQKLQELELNKGGVAFVQQRSTAKPNPTIIISLGGLGGKTLNMLKGKFKKEIGDCDHIYFRAIDTDTDDLDEISIIKANGQPNPLKSANMEANETMPLYNSAIAGLLMPAMIPPHIKAWINPALIGTVLDKTGAKQKRQIGRAMLCNSVVYNTIRSKLLQDINSAVAQARALVSGSVDVIILAGVSGGTGSGTIMDISYMIHDIFKSVGYTNDYQIAAYVYSPDAQFNVQGIVGNEAIIANLKVNGYAALKEIDYFMNIEGTKNDYTLQLDTSTVHCDKNIYSTCTVVSGYSGAGGINDINETMGRLTDQLMDMLTNIVFIDGGGNPVQLAKSLMSNEDAMLHRWLLLHPDRKTYHRSASYKYQILGYASVKIPREEILAYCVNKIYENVIAEFKNYKKLTKEIMDEVYSIANITDKATVLTYARSYNHSNPIRAIDSLEGNAITKKMIKNNNMYAYNIACELAEEEAKKITPAFRQALEGRIFEALKQQVENISDKYGPYMAVESVTHNASKLYVGDPDRPFSGIYDTLHDIADELDVDAQKALVFYDNGGKQKIAELALEATDGINFFGSKDDAINEYVSTSCKLANITKINTVLYPEVAAALRNVASQINTYNNKLFDVYTSVLDEVGSILNNDGQYFTQGQTAKTASATVYSLDIIKNGAQQQNMLHNFLNNFISVVDVATLADNFIQSMRRNREKWIAAEGHENFDVVREVRQLMDECLTHNNLKNNIIEKFITVAYHPTPLTPKELDEMWVDDSPTGAKMTALNAAANQIFNLLLTGSKTLAQSSMIPFTDFTNTVYVGTLEDAPLLSGIIDEIAINAGYKPVKSSAKNKFIMTTKYINVPMYTLTGMKEFNEAYVGDKTAGKHMDENLHDWARFQNPYTIDAVALDIQTKKLHQDEVKKYPDYKILVDVKEKADAAIDEYGNIEIIQHLTGAVRMNILDIIHEPANKAEFERQLTTALKANQDLNLVEFMEANGYAINRIDVKVEPADVELDRRDFNDLATNPDARNKYAEVPVAIADVYKWLRKSMNYMDLLTRNNPKFKEVVDMKNKIIASFKEANRYVDNVEIFAHALQTGMIKTKNNNVLVWNYMDGADAITVNLLAGKKFDKEYYLYHVFAKFNELSADRLKEYSVKATRKIENADVIDYSDIQTHVEKMLADDKLGDDFNIDTINQAANDQGVAKNYVVTDRDEDKGNPYKVLKRFYNLLNNSL